MSKSPILLISDRPERFVSLRASALAGRHVHLWLHGESSPPSWSTHLRGDPTHAATYEHLLDGDMLAIVDLADEARATRTARAICRALPQAEVVVLARRRGRRHASTRVGITYIDEGELLADAIESVLRRAQARKRLRSLRRALRGAGRCTFLVQNDPDPDAIAASLALRAALRLTPAESPIVSCGRVTRPENRRLLDALGIRVEQVPEDRLDERRPLVLVDVQPTYFGDRLGDVAAVIDHHPPAGRYRTRHRDVRTAYGACATMAAEYLYASGHGELEPAMATALLYGIVTDTKSLSRHTSEEDLEMFARLFPLAEHSALRRIQHPSYSPLPLRRLGAALQTVTAERGVAYLHLGELPRSEEHVVAQFAEFCLGIAGAEVSAVSGVFGSRLVMSTRALSEEARLGERLRAVFGEYGGAGGHPIMAKAVVRLSAWRAAHPYGTEAELAGQLGSLLRDTFGTGSAGRANRPPTAQAGGALKGQRERGGRSRVSRESDAEHGAASLEQQEM
jgi:nanoRNase/pAp phosphatase (c-di-AMP/oligoRNAs hydrolase)